MAPPESGVYLVQFFTPADDATKRIVREIAATRTPLKAAMSMDCAQTLKARRAMFAE
jgi:hypothetical protein